MDEKVNPGSADRFIAELRLCFTYVPVLGFSLSHFDKISLHLILLEMNFPHILRKNSPPKV